MKSRCDNVTDRVSLSPGQLPALTRLSHFVFTRTSGYSLSLLMTELDLEFSTSLTDDAGAFKLLELPPELCKLIETAVENLSPLR